MDIVDVTPGDAVTLYGDLDLAVGESSRVQPCRAILGAGRAATACGSGGRCNATDARASRCRVLELERDHTFLAAMRCDATVAEQSLQRAPHLTHSHVPISNATEFAPPLDTDDGREFAKEQQKQRRKSTSKRKSSSKEKGKASPGRKVGGSQRPRRPKEENWVDASRAKQRRRQQDRKQRKREEEKEEKSPSRRKRSPPNPRTRGSSEKAKSPAAKQQLMGTRARFQARRVGGGGRSISNVQAFAGQSLTLDGRPRPDQAGEGDANVEESSSANAIGRRLANGEMVSKDEKTHLVTPTPRSVAGPGRRLADGQEVADVWRNIRAASVDDESKTAESKEKDLGGGGEEKTEEQEGGMSAFAGAGNSMMTMARSQSAGEERDGDNGDNLKECPTCLAMIPRGNFEMHAIRCARNVAYHRKVCERCGQAVLNKDYAAHVGPNGSCPQREVTCKACGEAMPLSQLTKHKSMFCRERMVPCPYCGIREKAHRIETHMDECGTRTTKCDICKCFVRMHEWTAHQAIDCLEEKRKRKAAKRHKKEEEEREVSVVYLGWGREGGWGGGE